MADGLRVLQDDGVAETHYVYDGNNVVLELDDVGTVEADFTYVPAPYAQVLSQHRDLESSFYQFDGIHNVRQLTDDAQVVTDDYRFDARVNPFSTSGKHGQCRRESMADGAIFLSDTSTSHEMISDAEAPAA